MRNVNILLIALMVILLGSCKKQSIKHIALQKEVDRMNAKCPISQGIFGDITSVRLDGNTVVYNFEVKTQLVQLDKLKMNRDVVKESIMLELASNSGLKTIIDSNCDLKYIYKSGNETMTVDLTADELKQASKILSKPDYVASKRLETLVKSTRLQMPIQIDEATLLKDMTIEGEKVCYCYDITSDDFTPDLLRNEIDNFKQNIKNNLSINDPSMEALLEAVVDNKMNLCYRYEFPSDNETVEIDFDLDELKEIVRE